jgi:hypothetical protein
MKKLTLRQGEAKPLEFVISDEHGNEKDVSGATLSLGVKLDNANGSCVISKDDADFTVSDSADGVACVATVNVTSTDTNQTPGIYLAELWCIWAGPPEKRLPANFLIKIEQAVVPPA